MGFKERLKEARLSKGMSRSQLAENLNVTVSAIGNYETGISFPKEEYLFKIFEILETSPNFLFQDNCNTIKKEKSIEFSNIEKKLIADFRSLNEQGQKYVLQTVDIVKDKYKKVISEGHTNPNNDDSNEYITEVAARGNSHQQVKINKRTIEKDLKNATLPDFL